MTILRRSLKAPDMRQNALAERKNCSRAGVPAERLNGEVVRHISGCTIDWRRVAAHLDPRFQYSAAPIRIVLSRGELSRKGDIPSRQIGMQRRPSAKIEAEICGSESRDQKSRKPSHEHFSGRGSSKQDCKEHRPTMQAGKPGLPRAMIMHVYREIKFEICGFRVQRDDVGFGAGFGCGGGAAGRVRGHSFCSGFVGGVGVCPVLFVAHCSTLSIRDLQSVGGWWLRGPIRVLADRATFMIRGMPSDGNSPIDPRQPAVEEDRPL